MNTKDINRANERIKKLSYILRHIETAGVLSGGTKIQILSKGIPREGKKVSEKDLVYFGDGIDLQKSSVAAALRNEIECIKNYIRENI
jgi:hypothetical protein